MKKIFLIATAVAAAVLASCSKNTETIVPETDNADGPKVCLTLGGDAATRAFFDRTAAAEWWESELNTLTVYAFDSSGNILIKYTLNSSEISAKSAQIALPNSVSGTTCSFYAVANADYGDVSETTIMDLLTESVTLGEYNGTFEQTAKARKRTAGFVMTGKAKATIAFANSSTNVSVTLKRTVAKIAVRAKTDASFNTTYGNGTVTINSIKISKASAASNSFYKTDIASRYSLYEFTQTPQASAGNFDGLFYIYENGVLREGIRVMLTLTGYFDADGSNSTTTDRSDVEYVVELLGSGSGIIGRNGYYRVDAAIKGLPGNSNAVTVTVTAAEWENPATQSIDLGN
jgi:hypothetical protein